MLSINECRDLTVDAIYEANDRYSRWSGGRWLNEAGVEPIIQITLAEFLSARKYQFKTTVDLEVAYSEIFERAGAATKRGRKPQLLTGTKRADLVLFDRERAPVVCFEIKRNWTRSSAWEDGHRLCTLIEKAGTQVGGSLRAGIFAFFQSASPRSRRDGDSIVSEIVEELQAFDLDVNSHAGPWIETEYDDGIWKHQALCFIIKPR